MKKLNKFAIAAIAALSLTTVGTFAWFVTSNTSQAVDVSTGTVTLEPTRLLIDESINRLPGEEVILNDGQNNTIKNGGTRDGVIEIKFDDTMTAVLPSTVKLADIPDEFKADYEEVDGKLQMTKARRDKVLSVVLKNPNTLGWVDVDGTYYAQFKANGGEAELTQIVLTLEGELGGNKKQADGKLSASRQWEQGTKFNVAYQGTAVQATAPAIVDVFGQEVLDAIPAAWLN